MRTVIMGGIFAMSLKLPTRATAPSWMNSKRQATWPIVVMSLIRHREGDSAYLHPGIDGHAGMKSAARSATRNPPDAQAFF